MDALQSSCRGKGTVRQGPDGQYYCFLSKSGSAQINANLMRRTRESCRYLRTHGGITPEARPGCEIAERQGDSTKKSSVSKSEPSKQTAVVRVKPTEPAKPDEPASVSTVVDDSKASQPTQFGVRLALVIGNSAYVNVPRLANPTNDARLMADTLQSLGFTLVGGGAQLDLDESRLRQVIQAFGRQLQGSDVGLFYYAGHGVQVRGANYLVPIDANPVREADLDFQMVDGGVILRQMESSGTKLNIVMLDACRNNPFAGRGLRSSNGGLAQMSAPEGTLISFATQPGNVALEGSGADSPYAEALAKIMRKPGLDIFHTFNDVGLAVSNSTAGAQKPWISSSPIKGDFYFAGAKAVSNSN